MGRPTSLTVKADGVTKAYGPTRAVAGVSAGFGPGLHVLLGPRGAGKTTLLRMIATVSAPDSGRLELLGNDSADPSGRLAVRRRLGYLPQEAGFHGNFTAFEFVDYVAILKEMTNRRERHDEVRRVLALAGLGDVHTKKKIKALPGGMRPRVGLAQALLGQPDLLVLDEPAAGLDPEQRLHFRELISAAPGQTVLLATDQTEDVTPLCTRVVVMSAGAIRFDGAPDELAAAAAGKVWLAPDRVPGAQVAWRRADGHYRQIGEPPPGARLVRPTLADGYLLLIGQRHSEAVA